jgi:hypothetical protein
MKDYATVNFIGAAPESASNRLFEIMQIDSAATWANVFLSVGKPRVCTLGATVEQQPIGAICWCGPPLERVARASALAEKVNGRKLNGI